MILQQVNSSDFWSWLNHDKDSSYYRYFSYEAAKALFDYLEEASDNGEQEAADNYDPVAWCVEFSEYNSLADFNKIYDKPFKSWSAVSEETIVIELDNGGAVVGEF